MFFVAERFFSVIWLLNDDNPDMSMLDLICNRAPTKRRQHSTTLAKQQQQDEGEEEEAPDSGASEGSSASSPKYTTASSSSYSSSVSGSVSLSPKRHDSIESPQAAAARKQVQQHQEVLVACPPPDPGLMPLIDLPPPATTSCNSLASAAAAAAAADAAARAAAFRTCRSAEGPLLSSGPSFLSVSPCRSGSRGKTYADAPGIHAAEGRSRPAAAAAALGFAYFDEIGGFKGTSSKLRSQQQQQQQQQLQQQQRQRTQGPGLDAQRRRVKRHTQPPLQVGVQPQQKLEQQALVHMLPRDGLPQQPQQQQQQQQQQQVVSGSHGIRCRSQGSLGRTPELSRQHWQLQLQGQLAPWQHQQQQLQQKEQQKQQQLQQEQQLRPHDTLHRKNSFPFSRSASLCDRSFRKAATASVDACGLLSESAAGAAATAACRHVAATRSCSRLDGYRGMLRWSRSLGSSQHASCCIYNGSNCCSSCLNCCSSSSNTALSYPRSSSPGVYGRHRPSSYMQRRRYSTVCWPVDRAAAAAAAAARTAAAVGGQPHPPGCCRAAAASWWRQQHEEAAAAAAAAATKAAARAASDVLSLYRSAGANSSAAAAATASAAATAAASAVAEAAEDAPTSSGAAAGVSMSCQHFIPYSRSSSLHALQQQQQQQQEQRQRQRGFSSRHAVEKADWRPFSSPSLSPCAATNRPATAAEGRRASPLTRSNIESGPASCSSIRRCCCCSSCSSRCCNSSRNTGATSISDLCRGSPPLHQFR